MPEIKDKLVTAESLKNAFDELNNKSYEKLDVTYNKSNNTLVFQNSPELQKKVYVDKSLTKSDNAADAKVTGDAIAELKNENTELKSDLTHISDTISSPNLFEPINKNGLIDGINYSYNNGVMRMVGLYTGSATRIKLQTLTANVGDKFSINCNTINKPTIYIMNGSSIVETYRQSDFSVTFEMPTETVTIEAYTGGVQIDFTFLLSLQKNDVPTTSLTKTLNSYGTNKYFGDLVYEAIGDSLTYGFTGSWNADGTQERIEYPYADVVRDILGFKSAINKGETGTTIANDLDKKGTYYPISNDNRLNSYVYAKVISVMGGTNDYHLGTALGTVNDTISDNTFHSGWKRIFGNLLNRFTAYGCFLFVIIPPVTSGLYTANSVGHTFNDYIKATIEECREYGIPVLDMSLMGRLSAQNKATYTSDGIHFNQKYVSQIFAPTVAEFIKQYFS